MKMTSETSRRRSLCQRMVISSFVHLLLFFVLITYCIVGGIIMRAIEQQHEIENWIDVNTMRIGLLNEFYLNAIDLEEDPDVFMVQANDMMWNYERTLLTENIGIYHKEGYFKVHKDWSFEQSFYYCFAVITTMGYGIVTPNSIYGKAATIVFAIFGIPIAATFYMFAGNTVARHLQNLCSSICGSCRKDSKVRKSESYRSHDIVGSEEIEKEKSAIETSGTDTMPAGTVIVLQSDADLRQQSEAKPYCCPIFLAFLLLTGYIALGASLFSMWSSWTYLDSVHIVFTCLTTIGYGEMLARDKAPSVSILLFIYMLFGFIITASCCILIYESLSKSIKNLGKRLRV